MHKKTYNHQFMKSDYGSDNRSKSNSIGSLSKPPLLEKPCAAKVIIDLPDVSGNDINKNDLYKCMLERRSHRKYSEEALTLAELAFLLWATQGVTKIVGRNDALIRTVPSGGKAHAFETYLIVNNVAGLAKGIYRYLSLSHQLAFLRDEENLWAGLKNAVGKEVFVQNGSVIFIWSCIPYRSEYHKNIISPEKSMLIDIGHVCQNLYLACEAIDCGTCAVAAYDQKEMDKFLDLDGEDEFVIYLAPVGKVIRDL